MAKEIYLATKAKNIVPKEQKIFKFIQNPIGVNNTKLKMYLFKEKKTIIPKKQCLLGWKMVF